MHNRTLNWIIAFGCHELLVAAYYFQYVEGLNPCPLCIVQRVAVFAIGVFALILALSNSKPLGIANRALNGLGLVSALLGVVAAGRQVWLQSLPADKIPECGPSLEYRLEVFSANEVLAELFKGSGECAKVDWALLGFSMGAWMLAFFVVASLFFALRLWRK